MPKCHHLRALALLGALTLYFVLWPIYCCAARPMSTADSSGQTSANLSRSVSIVSFVIATEIGDNTGTNIQTMDFLNTPNDSYAKPANDNDESTIVHKNSENSHRTTPTPISIDIRPQPMLSESTTTSIFELFHLGRSRDANVRLLSRTDRSVHLNSSNSKNNSVSGAKRVKNNKTKLSTLERNERSANLSHITGSARKIQLYIKNRFLQLLPDGTVNGTTDDLSDYCKFNLVKHHVRVEVDMKTKTLTL